MTRSEAIEHLKNIAIYSFQDGYTDEARQALDMAIKALEEPERKTGRWIRHIRTDLGQKLNDTIECSECRIAFPTENMFRRSFCPNCGSYNRGESE